MASTIIWLRWQDPNKECRRSPLKRYALWSHYRNSSRIRAILCFRSRGSSLGLDTTIILFGGLAVYGALSSGAASIMGVRLRVDAGLLAIVLITIALRRPFTLQYARERVPRDRLSSPTFISTNYTITAAWAAAFAVVVAADALLLFRPDLPSWIGIAATILALAGAFKFTEWFPERNSPRP